MGPPGRLAGRAGADQIGIELRPAGDHHDEGVLAGRERRRHDPQGRQRHGNHAGAVQGFDQSARRLGVGHRGQAAEVEHHGRAGEQFRRTRHALAHLRAVGPHAVAGFHIGEQGVEGIGEDLEQDGDVHRLGLQP